MSAKRCRYQPQHGNSLRHSVDVTFYSSRGLIPRLSPADPVTSYLLYMVPHHHILISYLTLHFTMTATLDCFTLVPVFRWQQQHEQEEDIYGRYICLLHYLQGTCMYSTWVMSVTDTLDSACSSTPDRRHFAHYFYNSNLLGICTIPNQISPCTTILLLMWEGLDTVLNIWRYLFFFFLFFFPFLAKRLSTTIFSIM